MKECPKHKSSENMRKNLTNRLKKLQAGVEKRKRAGKGNQQGIKKADMQCVLAGFPNVGKSTIFKTLTKLNPKISPHPFTTSKIQLGTFKFEDAPIQIIDGPPFPDHDKSLVNSTDTILLIIDNLEQIKKAKDLLYRSKAKVVLVYNKADQLSQQDKRKVEAQLKSKFKKHDYLFFSSEPSKTELEELHKKVFGTFPIIRTYTKEPKKERTKEPMILKIGTTLGEAAEKILKGMSKKIKQARIWGPSSKFSGQSVGIDHELKDKDTIEFHIK